MCVAVIVKSDLICTLHEIFDDFVEDVLEGDSLARLFICFLVDINTHCKERFCKCAQSIALIFLQIDCSQWTRLADGSRYNP